MPTEKPQGKIKPSAQVDMEQFEAAVRELAADEEFKKLPPTREQIARAWALAVFRKTNPSEKPTHADLVAALRELFRQYKVPRPASASHRPRSKQSP